MNLSTQGVIRGETASTLPGILQAAQSISSQLRLLDSEKEF